MMKFLSNPFVAAGFTFLLCLAGVSVYNSAASQAMCMQASPMFESIEKGDDCRVTFLGTDSTSPVTTRVVVCTDGTWAIFHVNMAVDQACVMDSGDGYTLRPALPRGVEVEHKGIAPVAPTFNDLMVKFDNV